MTENLIAITLSDPVYPGFMSINREEDGSVTVHVRQAPRKFEGVRVCGRTCSPGKDGCNNYCNFDQERPMSRHPERIDIAEPGAAVSLTIAGADWDAAVASLSAG